MHLPDGKSSRAIESLTRRKHVSLLLRSCIARIQLFPRVHEARLYRRYVRYRSAINKQLHLRPRIARRNVDPIQSALSSSDRLPDPFYRETADFRAR